MSARRFLYFTLYFCSWAGSARGVRGVLFLLDAFPFLVGENGVGRLGGLVSRVRREALCVGWKLGCGNAPKGYIAMQGVECEC
ncbi:hypothetical protein EJ06DRAFT_392989 [Trichodelitschia bisporula]|uniref:Secreted protein n=1 Tax=Trichodelitschia bisporula TaxID=703511 RepID=A0A6G1I0E6_9PEZI|nr:hypothetical protein EJ06DRAFT_392989 [Trichodelitschia bisporula]